MCIDEKLEQNSMRLGLRNLFIQQKRNPYKQITEKIIASRTLI